MSADLIQGKKGSGKSKLAVMWIRDALADGRKVATNLDIYLDKLMPPMSKATVLRLPDKPTVEALEAAGIGSAGDRYDATQDGLMVLDELATWMNARSFNDPKRAGVINWLVHSRKRNWETVFICQDLVQIDKQVRESQVEYVTRCVRADRIRIPIVGGAIAALFGRKAAYLPKFHIATRRMGCDTKGLKADSWVYKTGGPTIQGGYDTLQEFSDDYPHGAHSLLSAWHLVGRYLPEHRPWWRRIFAVPPARPRPRPRNPVVAQLAASYASDPDRAWKLAARYVRALEHAPR